MLRRCSDCGGSFDAQPWQRLCWTCWRQQKRDDELADEYQRGYADGYDAGLRAGQRALPPATMDRELISRAVCLCHPDRHPPERAAEANAITAMLLDLRRAAA